MTDKVSKRNNTLLRVLLVSAAVLILCGAAIGTAGAASGSWSGDVFTPNPDGYSNDTEFAALADELNAGSHEGTAIYDSGERMLTLLKDVKLGGTLKIGGFNDGDELTLDLNDRILSRNSASEDFSVITVDSNHKWLKLTDNSAAKTMKYFNVDDKGLWTLAENQSIPTEHYVTGGCITGGTGKHDGRQGGGVYVSSGNFTMAGGNIVGNSARGTSTNDLGGGVYVHGDEDSQTYSTFTMTGGKIIGNYANSGGGVYVGKSGVFDMGSKPSLEGAFIEENSAEYGGGVSVYKGTFHMSGKAVISGNSAQQGGGVYIEGGEFTMSDTTACISGNNAAGAESAGFAASAADGTFALSGENIAGNLTEDESGIGGGVCVMSGTFTMSDGSIEKNSAEGGGGVCVIDDGSVSSFIMSGGRIAENKAYLGCGVCVVDNGSGSSFTMSGGSIEKNSASEEVEAGGGVCVINGTFTISDGSITENYASMGGGVCLVIDNGSVSSFSMSGGRIAKNTAMVGGGVCLVMENGSNGSSVSMSGGSITGNTAMIAGGGVCVTGSFTMSGGSITENSSLSGGGVCVMDEGSGSSFTQSGGSITKNRGMLGGGVCVMGGTFNVSGMPVIKDNTGMRGGKSNVTLLEEDESGQILITVTGALGSGAEIWIAIPDGGQFARAGAGYTIKQADANCFHLDSYSSGSAVIKDNKLCWPWVAKIVDGGVTKYYGTVADAVTNAGAGDTITMVANSKESMVTIEAGKDIILDLNGHVLQNDGTNSVIRIKSAGESTEAGKLTVTDSNSSVKHYFSKDPVTGLYTYVGERQTNGLIEVVGGCITGGKNVDHGGGGVDNRGTFMMEGGNIVGNWAVYSNPGCGLGGGVYVGGAEGQDTLFTMSGGKIVGNYAHNGAGVYVTENHEFTMSGGSVEENNAEHEGGGVYVQDEGVLRVSGSSVIKDNRKGYAANNVVLKIDEDDEDEVAEFVLAGELTGDIRITEVFGKVPQKGRMFGTAEEEASGEENITADGTNLFGRISDGKLVWAAPASKSSKSQGTSIWLTAEPTPTPTATPTAEPTPVPTPEVPTVKPVATETPAAKSPMPLAGILAGLGAAAAVFALRRK